MPQLDGLRAFAVLSVLVYHFIPKYFETSPLGWIGVRLFFVLSGFLITGILLGGRDLVRTGVQTAGLTLRQFYIRRFLRIFPIYYAVLLGLAICGAEGVRENLGWHLAYLSNFQFVRQGYFPMWLAHFWSLSVEEQFYLVWPLIIFFVPRRGLIPVLACAIAAGPLYRFASQLFAFSDIACEVLLPPCLDTLAAGALLALTLRASPERNLPAWKRVGWAGFVLYVALQVLDYMGWSSSAGFALSTTAFAAAAAGLIGHASVGFSGWRRALLEFKPLMYVGTISYGLYVYHELVSTAVDKLSEAHRLQLPSLAAAVVLKFALSFLLAGLSWRLFEKPINDLKRFFPMKAGKAGMPSPPLIGSPLADSAIIRD